MHPEVEEASGFHLPNTTLCTLLQRWRWHPQHFQGKWSRDPLVTLDILYLFFAVQRWSRLRHLFQGVGLGIPITLHNNVKYCAPFHKVKDGIQTLSRKLVRHPHLNVPHYPMFSCTQVASPSLSRGGPGIPISLYCILSSITKLEVAFPHLFQGSGSGIPISLSIYLLYFLLLCRG